MLEPVGSAVSRDISIPRSEARRVNLFLHGEITGIIPPLWVAIVAALVKQEKAIFADKFRRNRKPPGLPENIQHRRQPGLPERHRGPEHKQIEIEEIAGRLRNVNECDRVHYMFYQSTVDSCLFAGGLGMRH